MITRNEMIVAIHSMALCFDGKFSGQPAYTISCPYTYQRGLLYRIITEEGCAWLDAVEYYNDHVNETECIDNLNRADLTQVYLAVREEYRKVSNLN